MNMMLDSECSLRFVIGGLGVGGAETHLAKVLPQLVKQGWAVTIYTYSEANDLALSLTQNGVKVVQLYSDAFSFLPSAPRRGMRLLRTILLMAKQFRQSPARITHFFLPEAYIVGMIACLLSFDKSIRIMSRRSLNYYQYRRNVLFRVFERILHRHCDFVLGNSREVINQLHGMEGVPVAKLGLIYNGIDLSKFDEARRVLPLGELAVSRPLTLVIVANLIPYKGHEDLLRALGLVKNELPQGWVLRVVGEDRGIQVELVALAKSLGIDEHVVWMGKRSDIASILTQSDIGLLCSHEEGFSNAILEGMASGLPMIVTRVGGNAEAVEDGKTGLTVPVASPESLARAIALLGNDSAVRKRMGVEGRLRAQRLFSLTACVSRYERVYSSLQQGVAPTREEFQQVALVQESLF